MLRIRDYVWVMISLGILIVFFLIFEANFSGTRTFGSNTKPLNLSDEELVHAATPEESDYWEEVLVIYGSNKENNYRKNVCNQLANLKIPYRMVAQPSQCPTQAWMKAKIIILAMDNLGELKDADLLFAYVQQGKNLIVCNCNGLNGAEECQDQFGVVSLDGKKTLEGMIVFQGLLVQGLQYYFDYEIKTNNVHLDAFCKSWISEYNSKQNSATKDKVSLLWERKAEDGRIFVFNNTFLVNGEGLGLFTSVLAELKGTFVYPIVNIKLELIDYMPDVSNGKEDLLQELYYRNEESVVKDIFWPSIEKILSQNDILGTFYPHVSEEDRASKVYQYLKKEMEKKGYEVCENGIVGQYRGIAVPIGLTGHEYNEQSVFKMQNQMTAMGMVSHCTNMREVLGTYGSSDENEWSDYSLKLSKLLYATYKDADWMEKATLSSGMEAYERYLLMEPEVTDDGKSIHVKIDNFHDYAYLMVHTDKELHIVSNDAYKITEVGDDFYLLTMYKKEADIIY